MRYAPFLVLPLLLFATISAFAQQPVTSNPQAAALATSALAALTGATQVSDVTLTGTGTRTAGPDVESGNFTLKALGQYQSRLDLVMSGGTRSEVFNIANNGPQGFWTGMDGTVHAMANHNCVAGVVWFFPALSSLSQISSQNFAAIYIGSETRNGVAVQHIQIVPQSPAGSTTGQLFSELGTTDVYLDPISYLPQAIAFYTHPDYAANVNIPVEVDFSNYHMVQGVQIPFRVQRFVNGSLFFDLTIQSVRLNTGLTSAAFSSN